jgi:hypothetical protein
MYINLQKVTSIVRLYPSSLQYVLNTSCVPEDDLKQVETCSYV